MAALRCTGDGSLQVQQWCCRAIFNCLDDYDKSLRFVESGGNAQLLSLRSQEHAPTAVAVFRLFSETLYSEPRASNLWREPPSVVLEGLRWALTASEGPASSALDAAKLLLLAPLTDAVQLWIRRCAKADAQLLAGTLGPLLPRLLQRLAQKQAEPEVVLPLLRFLVALAQTIPAHSPVWTPAVLDASQAVVHGVLLHYAFTAAVDLKVFAAQALVALQAHAGEGERGVTEAACGALEEAARQLRGGPAEPTPAEPTPAEPMPDLGTLD